MASEASSAPASSAEPVAMCATPGCQKPSTLQCPTCKQLEMPPSFFCSQDCFKANWKEHNVLHKLHKERLSFRPPAFDYTGPLRPHYVTPRRSMPSSIPAPDYALTSVPQEEMNSRSVTTIEIKTPQQIALMREACRIGREVLDLGGQAVRPGITTEEIDLIVHNACVERGAYPSPLNYRGFPKSCCTSVNEVICHGIPDARPLEDGDIVNIDISVYYKGMHADLNETFCVGTKVPAKHKLLIKATHDSLMRAIQKVGPGAMFRDFGGVISKHVGLFNYDVVRSYCGHGIGSLFHCAPNIPHYAKNKAVGQCKPGMVFTIEPMINLGRYHDVLWLDDWTAVAADGLASAQFEHTMVVTETGVEVLTARTAQSVPFWWETDPDSVASVMAEALGKEALTAAGDLQPNLVAAACVSLSVDGKGGVAEKQLPVVVPSSLRAATEALKLKQQQAAEEAAKLAAEVVDEDGDEDGDEKDAGGAASAERKKKKKKKSKK